MPPLTVAFTDTSTGIIANRFWDFGDGNTTNTALLSVTHAYTAVGTNNISLAVSGPFGTNALTRTNYIVVANPAPVVLTIQLLTNRVRLTWPFGILQSASQLAGPYTNLTGTISP